MKEISSSTLHFANTLADAAGEIIRQHYRVKTGVGVKADNTPVTLADHEAERKMRELIASAFPDHGIIGEEYGSHNPDAEYVWVLDPIDGTRSFIAGIPLFTTLIALTRRGMPVLGVIDQPVSGERWEGAHGHPSMLNGAVIHSRQCPALDQATFSTTSPYIFRNKREAEACEKISGRCRNRLFGGDAYMYAMLASGFVDLIIESMLKPHDFCAIVPVIEGAGGAMTDWRGQPLTLHSDGSIVAAGDKALHRQVIDQLAAVAETPAALQSAQA